MRAKDRIYREDVFYGRGKKLSEATEQEIDIDIKERESENPLAYRSGKNVYIYSISENELDRVAAWEKNEH